VGRGEGLRLLYLLSAPGGGSSLHTIYRPPELNGGLRPGQLLRDSSPYEMAIYLGDGTCVYAIRISFAELWVEPDVGVKLGLSIRLNDSDGRGFGIVTLVGR